MAGTILDNGMAVTLGLVAAVAAVGVVALGITVWSLGEVTCSARFFEYCGTVAPKDQVAEA